MDGFSLNIVVPKSKTKLGTKKRPKKQSKLSSSNETIVQKPNKIGSSAFKKANLDEANPGRPKKPAFIRAKGEKQEFGSKPFLLSEKFKTTPVIKSDLNGSEKQEDSSEGFSVSFVKPRLFQKPTDSKKDALNIDKSSSEKKRDTSGNGLKHIRYPVNKTSMLPSKSDNGNNAEGFEVEPMTFQNKRTDADFTGDVVKTSKWFGDQSNSKNSVRVQFPSRSVECGDSKKVGSGQLTRNENKKRKFEDFNDAGMKVDKKRRKDEGFKDVKKTTGPISSLFDSTDVMERLDDADVKPLEERLFSKKTFEEVGVHPHLIGNLEQLFGIKNMTVVQKKTIPVLMTEKDALVRSQTGSGKTLAYAIPIMHSLQSVTPHLTRKDGVKALIVLPTRELALQTYECFTKLMRAFTWIVPGIVIGGEKRKSEKVRLRKGITVLIGTPGRLLDHAEHTGSLSLHGIDWLIIDEADKLLEMGYEKDISQLISIVESQREAAETVGRKQTVLLSATLTSGVERLANLTLQDPAHIDACSNNVEEATDVLTIPQSLEQKYVVVPAKLRLVALASYIIDVTEVRKSNKILVFMATQDMVDFYMDLIPSVLSSSVKFYKLHGNMSQGDRTEVFNAFRSSDKGVLLSTDVAARGLDLPKVDWIVQYTAPTTPAEYVHRVGRTARVGSTGSALLFLLPSELHFVSMLNTSRIKLEEVSVDAYLKCLMKIHLESKDGQRWGGGVEGAATVLQHNFEHAVIDDDALHELAAKAYKSWVRFYATYPKDLRVVFDFKSLHLGHHAKSFALRDPPKAIGGIGKPKKGSKFATRDRTTKPKKRKAENLGHITESSRTKKLITSEFDSGLKPLRRIT